MTVSVAVFLAIGVIAIIAFVRAIGGHGWPSPRQIAGLWLSGLFLLLIGRGSPALGKGLALIMVLAYVLTVGIPGISVLSSTKKATPSPSPSPASKK